MDFLADDIGDAWRIHRFLTVHLIHLEPGAKVLDIGCGLGVTVAYLREQGLDAYGVDTRDVMPDAPCFVRKDAKDTGFPDDTFDVVTESLMFGQIEVIDRTPEQYQAILNEINRVLKPGGHLLSYPGSGFLDIAHFFPQHGFTYVRTPPSWTVGLAQKSQLGLEPF